MFWIVVKGILDDAISDYLWARAVVLTSPTVDAHTASFLCLSIVSSLPKSKHDRWPQSGYL
jgi:hypothetical protein